MQMVMKINLTTPYSRSLFAGKPGRLGRFNKFPRCFKLLKQVDEFDLWQKYHPSIISHRIWLPPGTEAKQRPPAR